ncbi:MAG: uridine diphosphate-N-acetylglucosamine-binding protein YvcK [Actinomycetota bacterium]|nr:uridine diphosphate-N-acetylglucosamine-binding protein YvcK [Actinomycetota bacterium]
MPTSTDGHALLEVLDFIRPRPHVVAVGGGKGLARALRAIRSYAGWIDAIVTVADDGGSSGRLAPDLDIPPPGDIRKALIALTPDVSVWRQLYEYRFEGADVRGHSLGNLIIAALAEIEGSFEGALRSSERLLGAVGSVIPASPWHLELAATIDDREVRGQVNISLARGAVTAMRVLPDDAPVSESAVSAIESADQIVLGPGSLYTSIIAAMVVPGITDAINRSTAPLIYVANTVTQDGETLGMDAVDHLESLIRLTGVRPPGAIVASDSPVSVDPPLEAVGIDAEAAATYGADLVTADLLDETAERPCHDPTRLGAVLRGLVQQ